MKYEFDDNEAKLLYSAIEAEIAKGLYRLRLDLQELADRNISPKEIGTWLDEIEEIVHEARGLATRYDAITGKLNNPVTAERKAK